MSQADLNPTPSSGWFVLLVAVVVAVAMTGWFWGSTQAGYLFAAVFAALGIARLVSPPVLLGPLVVRTRMLDVAMCLGQAVALGLITYALPTYG
ncbi:MAG: DUF3017 domain-containing protein [Actinomycetales bacterium]